MRATAWRQVMRVRSPGSKSQNSRAGTTLMAPATYWARMTDFGSPGPPASTLRPASFAE